MENKSEVCYFCKKNEKQYREELHPEFKALKKDRKEVFNKATKTKEEIDSKKVGALNHTRNDHLKPLVNEYESLASENKKLILKIKEIKEQTQFNKIDPFKMGSFKEMVEFIMGKYFNKDFKYIQPETHKKTIKVCNDCLKYVEVYYKMKRETEFFPSKILSEEERGISIQLSGEELELELIKLRDTHKERWIPNPLEE